MAIILGVNLGEPLNPRIRAAFSCFVLILLGTTCAKLHAQISEEILLPLPKLELDLSRPPAPDKPSRVPPGFETLAAPQSTLVDIYFAGQFVTSQMATFNADEIEFSQPADILELIPNLLDADALANSLRGPLPTHLEFICHYQGQRECGELKPERAGVIFNEGLFRADLFISGEFLGVQTAGHRKYLPESDSGWSLLQSFNSAYSGGLETQADVYALNSNSIVAYRENRFQITSNYLSTGENSIDTAVLRRDWQGMEYQGGYFRSHSGDFQFMSDTAMRGLRVASSLDTRDDLRQSAGNALQVFLPSRSEVAIYKDGRLISARFYDAGNQVLDTSQLPGGAYDVTLQIRDSAGNLNEETRFYVKSSQLPPIDQALFFVEAGELLEQEHQHSFAAGSELYLVRAGYHARLNDHFSAMLGLTRIDEHSNLELGLTQLGRYHDVSIGAFVGDQSRAGGRINFRSRFADWYLNANYREVRNPDYDSGDLGDLTGPSSRQASLNISTLLPFGRIELSSRYNRRDDEDFESHGLRYELPRVRIANADLLMGLQFSRENEVNFSLFSLELRFTGEHVSGSLRPEYSHVDGNDLLAINDWQTNAVMSWQDRDLLRDSDLRFDVRGRNELGQSSYGAEADWAGNHGRLRVQSENITQRETSSRGEQHYRRYNANGFTSFMINDSSRKLGGREQSQSALLIEIEGELSDASFDVLIDGNPRGVAYPNRTTAINVRPFESYRVQLRQRGSSFVDYDQQVRTVTVYPGNVVSLRWEVAEVDVVFGRVVDADNNPLANALINGVSGLSTTDDAGLFQAEIRRDIKQLRLETLDSSCEVNVPAYELKRGIAALGTLPCRAIPTN